MIFIACTGQTTMSDSPRIDEKQQQNNTNNNNSNKKIHSNRARNKSEFGIYQKNGADQ